MTASVHDAEARQKGVFESLLVRELSRPRRASESRPKPPDPSTCLVTRAQLLQRVSSKYHAQAMGLLQGAIAAVEDASVHAALTLTIELVREAPDLIGLPDVDLLEMLDDCMGRLRMATRDRLLTIARRVSATGADLRPAVVAEHRALRRVVHDTENAVTLLLRMVRLDTDFEDLCSFEPVRK